MGELLLVRLPQGVNRKTCDSRPSYLEWDLEVVVHRFWLLVSDSCELDQPWSLCADAAVTYRTSELAICTHNNPCTRHASSTVVTLTQPPRDLAYGASPYPLACVGSLLCAQTDFGSLYAFSHEALGDLPINYHRTLAGVCQSVLAQPFCTHGRAAMAAKTVCQSLRRYQAKRVRTNLMDHATACRSHRWQ